ncbi:MAG: manganese-binding transcriptional regulator MntR [Pseudomonadota bacterium]
MSSARESAAAEIAQRAENFRRVREAHQSETAEDYVELIAELIDRHGVARVGELAERFGVTSATVNNTLRRLQRHELVRIEPYRDVALTPAGRQLAREARERHELVRSFLIAIGVDPETAEADAEGIEHHVSHRTLAAFRRFVKRQPGAG